MLRREFLANGVKLSMAAALDLKADKKVGHSNGRYLLDMVHFNPGEAPPKTAFLDPNKLRNWGYNGQVLFSKIEGVPTFDGVAPGLVPVGSTERQWAMEAAAHIEAQITAAKKAGLKVYAWMQLLVFPKAVVRQFKGEICNAAGQIDVSRPKTRELLAAQLNEIFDRFPALDGLVIRTGEVYMHDLPYHASSGTTGATELIQAGTAILDGAASHRALLGTLREEACVRRGRQIFYRTWDFGDGFHTNPSYYLSVTDAIEPHKNLVFSVKHQKGDFHQLTPFNPTLMIGRHPQIIEVQCQREAYGKGAHPYYIGQGVIEGWEDMKWVNPPGKPKGLEDVIRNPLCAGVWTWSRGGGWEGPFIKDEFWCSQNTYVISHYAKSPVRKEADLFREYAAMAGLKPGGHEAFRKLNLLATKAVLRGQLTTLGADIDLWWARDDKLAAPDLTDFVKRGLVEQSIAEKQESVRMWNEIIGLAGRVEFQAADTTEFVRSSCRYGLMKYSIIAAGWTGLMLARSGELTGNPDKARIGQAIAEYDRLWTEWRKIAASDPWSSTLVRDVAFADKPGMGAAIDKLR